MTRRTHTVKYMKSRYHKYQLIALICALFTVAAALLAALSGLQMAELKKAAAQKSDKESPSSEEVLNNWMEKEIENLRAMLTKTQDALAKEKTNSEELQKTIGSLKTQLSAVSAKASALEKMVSKPSPQPPASGQVPQPGKPTVKPSQQQPVEQTAPAPAPVVKETPQGSAAPPAQAKPPAPVPQPASTTVAPAPVKKPQAVSAPPAQQPTAVSTPQSQPTAASGEATSGTQSTTSPSPATSAQPQVQTAKETSPQPARATEEPPKVIVEESLKPAEKQ